jgi:hypothetical protein
MVIVGFKKGRESEGLPFFVFLLPSQIIACRARKRPMPLSLDLCVLLMIKTFA